MPAKRKINMQAKPATLGAATAKLGKNTQPGATAKPASAKAATAAQPNAKAERAELHAKARETVTAFYAGPSPTVHVSAGSKLADIVARVRHPIQQIAKNPTERDGSLAIAVARYNGSDLGAYLAATGSDLGGISRLASVGAIVVSGDTVKADRAKLNGVIIATHGAKHVPGNTATAKPVAAAAPSAKPAPSLVKRASAKPATATA